MSTTVRVYGPAPQGTLARTLWARGCTPTVVAYVEGMGAGCSAEELLGDCDRPDVLGPVALAAGRPPREVAIVLLGWALRCLDLHRARIDDVDAALMERAFTAAKTASDVALRRIAHQLAPPRSGLRRSGEAELVARAGWHAVRLALGGPHVMHDAEAAGGIVARALGVYRERWSPQLELGEDTGPDPEVVIESMLAGAREALARGPEAA